MGATLANNGVNPFTKVRAVDDKFVPKILAVMMMAGLYDRSGHWAWQTGLPAKTGVGGGIIAVVPGKLAIAAFSPPLDKYGTSVRGALAIQYVSEKLGLNLFDASR
jgi:glutaminase